jgi:hypothetical protein
MARLENGCLAMINNNLIELEEFKKESCANIVQSRCAKLLRDLPRNNHSYNRFVSYMGF